MTDSTISYCFDFDNGDIELLIARPTASGMGTWPGLGMISYGNINLGADFEVAEMALQGMLNSLRDCRQKKESADAT